MLIFIKCVKCSVNEDLTLFNQVDIEKKKQKKENVFSCGVCVCVNEDFNSTKTKPKQCVRVCVCETCVDVFNAGSKEASR